MSYRHQRERGGAVHAFLDDDGDELAEFLAGLGGKGKNRPPSQQGPPQSIATGHPAQDQGFGSSNSRSGGFQRKPFVRKTREEFMRERELKKKKKTTAHQTPLAMNVNEDTFGTADSDHRARRGTQPARFGLVSSSPTPTPEPEKPAASRWLKKKAPKSRGDGSPPSSPKTSPPSRGSRLHQRRARPSAMPRILSSDFSDTREDVSDDGGSSSSSSDRSVRAESPPAEFDRPVSRFGRQSPGGGRGTRRHFGGAAERKASQDPVTARRFRAFSVDLAQYGDVVVTDSEDSTTDDVSSRGSRESFVKQEEELGESPSPGLQTPAAPEIIGVLDDLLSDVSSEIHHSQSGESSVALSSHPASSFHSTPKRKAAINADTLSFSDDFETASEVSDDGGSGDGRRPAGPARDESYGDDFESEDFEEESLAGSTVEDEIPVQQRQARQPGFSHSSAHSPAHEREASFVVGGYESSDASSFQEEMIADSDGDQDVMRARGRKEDAAAANRTNEDEDTFLEESVASTSSRNKDLNREESADFSDGFDDDFEEEALSTDLSSAAPPRASAATKPFASVDDRVSDADETFGSDFEDESVSQSGGEEAVNKRERPVEGEEDDEDDDEDEDDASDRTLVGESDASDSTNDVKGTRRRLQKRRHSKGGSLRREVPLSVNDSHQSAQQGSDENRSNSSTGESRVSTNNSFQSDVTPKRHQASKGRHQRRQRGSRTSSDSDAAPSRSGHRRRPPVRSRRGSYRISEDNESYTNTESLSNDSYAYERTHRRHDRKRRSHHRERHRRHHRRSRSRSRSDDDGSDGGRWGRSRAPSYTQRMHSRSYGRSHSPYFYDRRFFEEYRRDQQKLLLEQQRIQQKFMLEQQKLEQKKLTNLFREGSGFAELLAGLQHQHQKEEEQRQSAQTYVIKTLADNLLTDDIIKSVLVPDHIHTLALTSLYRQQVDMIRQFSRLQPREGGPAASIPSQEDIRESSSGEKAQDKCEGDATDNPATSFAGRSSKVLGEKEGRQTQRPASVLQETLAFIEKHRGKRLTMDEALRQVDEEERCFGFSTLPI